jgi:hypothetical protein
MISSQPPPQPLRSTKQQVAVIGIGYWGKSRVLLLALAGPKGTPEFREGTHRLRRAPHNLRRRLCGCQLRRLVRERARID